MKTNMTERDKKLLVFMFMVVIVVGIGYWGVIPQIKAANSYASKAEDEEAEKKINQLKIVNAAGIDMQAEEYKSQIAEKKDEFYPIMTNSEVDRMMTEMARDEGLERALFISRQMRTAEKPAVFFGGKSKPAAAGKHRIIRYTVRYKEFCIPELIFFNLITN